MTERGPRPGTASSPAAAPGQHPARTVWLPSLLLLVAMLNLTLIVAGLKELVLDRLGGSTRDASLFFSIEMAAYILFAPLWGVLSDRLGRRKPMIVLGFAVSAPLYAAYAWAPDVPTLLLLRFVQGAATVMGWSVLMALVLDHAPASRRGRVMGLMGAALSLGIAVGAPLGGWLAGAFGVTAPVLAAAALFALLALGSLALLEPPRRRRRVLLGEVAATLRGSPRLLVPWLFYFVDRFTVGVFVVLFPLYLASLGVDDPALRGRYLALFLLPFALLQVMTGRLAERTGPYAPLVAGSLLYGLVLCVVGSSGLAALWWVMVLLGVLAAVMFPPTLMLTAELADPASRASAIGGFNLAGSLGFAVGPVVGAWAYTAGGYGFAFVVAGGLEIAVALAALAVMGRLARRSAATAAATEEARP